MRLFNNRITMKEIKCLAKVDGTDYYSESDLLNAIKVNGIIQEEIFLYEDYSYRSLSDNLDIGYCINSIPCFCRTGEKSRENYSYIAVRCCSVQKDKIRFDEACPKCGWCVAAYLAVHCKLEKDFGICYYDVNWSETNKETVFEYYLNWRKRIYDIMNIRSYTHYNAIGESTSIKMLDEAFYKQHLTEETKYKELSKGMSDNFFDGKLDRVVGEYLTFVSGKMQNTTIDNMEKPQRELKDLLQDELNSDESIRIIQKAIDSGLIEKTNTGLKWLPIGGKSGKAQLAYFCGKLCGYKDGGFRGNVGNRVSYEALEKLFNVSRLDRALKQVYEVKHPQYWRKIIDLLFD